MEWYYVDNNERRGPLSEAEFNELSRSGKIAPTTQVWRSGWANWMPFGEADSSVAGDGAAGIGRCIECGQPFPTGEMVQYEGSWVCPSCKPVFFQKVKEGITPAAEMVFAGFWIRFLAKVIDGIIVAVPGYAVQFGAAALTQGNQKSLLGVIGGSLLSFLIRMAYSTYLTGRFGATVGKLTCGLRVVTATGGKVSYGLACGRFFAEIVSAMILCIGYIMAAFDEEKRALHDRICNTRVTRTRA